MKPAMFRTPWGKASTFTIEEWGADAAAVAGSPDLQDLAAAMCMLPLEVPIGAWEAYKLGFVRGCAETPHPLSRYTCTHRPEPTKQQCREWTRRLIYATRRGWREYAERVADAAIHKQHLYPRMGRVARACLARFVCQYCGARKTPSAVCPCEF